MVRALEMSAVVLIAMVVAGAIDAACANEWNVAQSGAKADGQTDDTAVFQQLLDKAGAAGGGTVFVPAGRYRIDGTLSIPAAVTLKGVFNVPPTTRHEGSPDLHGTVLLAYAGRGSQEGQPFIRLAGHMASLSGVIVSYPEWSREDVPPIPYPPCVLAEDVENVGIFDCCFINPYEAVRLVRAARHLIRNVYGYPAWRGLYVDACYDIGRVENCHFWPFGVDYKPDDPYCLWINTQGVAFEFARTDWQYVLNTFCFGYGVGYKFSASAAGSCNGNFLGIGADSCLRPVLVEQSQPYGLLITNGEFVGRWGSGDAVGVEIAEKAGGKVSLQNCSFWGPIDRCIWQRSPHAQITASGCNFVNWDIAKKGSSAIQIDAGAAIIQGNTFAGEKLHVVVGEKVRSAILMGNQAPAGLRVKNHAGKRTVLIGNEGGSPDAEGRAGDAKSGEKGPR
ncbi:MAG: glycosyl hydrolase family 28-related protein [Pirellulales bacterium]